MPTHAQEQALQSSIEQLDDKNKFIKLVSEHCEEREFRTIGEFSRFMTNDYEKLTEDEQEEFMSAAEAALTEIQSGGDFGLPFDESKENEDTNEDE